MFSDQQYQTIIHEIKNCVCLISSSLQLIEKQHPEVIDFRYWNTTMSDISNLTNLFLELSAYRTPEDVTRKAEDLNKFFQNIINNSTTLFPENIRCIFDIESDLPEIKIDSLRLYHAILNLLKNGAEAMDMSGEISLLAFIQDDFLVIQVHDTGCGISEDNIEKIFTPMYTSKSNGTGLGLSITKNVIEAHNGTLKCSSILGEGTTFTILIPIT